MENGRWKMEHPAGADRPRRLMVAWFSGKYGDEDECASLAREISPTPLREAQLPPRRCVPKSSIWDEKSGDERARYVSVMACEG